jgi:hypothetical protein
MVVSIEGDRSARPTEELGGGAPSGADLPESDLVLALGAVILRTSEDHEVAIQLGEAVPVLGRRPLIFGLLLVAIPTLGPARLAQHELED